MASDKEHDEAWEGIEKDENDNSGEGSSGSPSPSAGPVAHDSTTEALGSTAGHLPSFPPSLRPLSPTALAAFNAAQAAAGVIYISRIPPGMQAPKVRHLMSAYGQVGRVYLQQEDPKRAYLRRKHTSTKKAHYTEGWVEFADKRVARSVAALLNAQPIGGKKGTRWRDDVWTMKYLPRFKWSMLTEQVAHEAAMHRDRLRVELSQSRAEQRDYLKQVELARVLDKRKERKRKREEEEGPEGEKGKSLGDVGKKAVNGGQGEMRGEGGKVAREERKEGTRTAKRRKGKEREKGVEEGEERRRGEELKSVLGSVF